MSILIFLTFVCVGFSQIGTLFFPPSVKYVNSDFNETISVLPVVEYGHFDYLNGDFHFTTSTQGFSLEEWLITSGGELQVYLLQDGICNYSAIPFPSTDCSGWSQLSDATWEEKCTLEGQTLTIDVAVANAQPLWLTETITQPGITVTGKLSFDTTSNAPPTPATLTPPSICYSGASFANSRLYQMLRK